MDFGDSGLGPPARDGPATDGRGFGPDAALATLSTLLLAGETVESVLGHVVRIATETVANTDGASASVLRLGNSGPAFAATDGVRKVDRQQHQSGRGPGIEVIRSLHRVHVALAHARPAWPEFADAALARGFRAVVALPLVAAAPVGTLVLYSRSERIDASEIEAAEAFARQAAVVLANAAALHSAIDGQRQLEDSVRTREVIGQAQGLLMARHTCRAESAFDLLRRWSQLSNRKLRDVAAELVDEHERTLSE